MIVHHHKDANPEPASGPVFTGQVHRRAITGESNAKRLYLGLVKFSPGARTVWHTHTFEQGLVIVEGKGIVATEAQEHVVEPGDVILIPEGETTARCHRNTMGRISTAVPDRRSGTPVARSRLRTLNSTFTALQSQAEVECPIA
jgi:quercetin dioxygenase-like cupin family protein